MLVAISDFVSFGLSLLDGPGDARRLRVLRNELFCFLLSFWLLPNLLSRVSSADSSMGSDGSDESGYVDASLR